MLIEVGGFQSFVERAPDKFFDLVAGEYTWFFLVGWGMVNFFMIGADWAFAQRFISVRNEKEAKKSAYLFGILYLVSPFFMALTSSNLSSHRPFGQSGTGLHPCQPVGIAHRHAGDDGGCDVFRHRQYGQFAAQRLCRGAHR